jgi:hypothetical protein
MKDESEITWKKLSWFVWRCYYSGIVLEGLVKIAEDISIVDVQA